MTVLQQRSRGLRAILVLAAAATLAACGGSSSAPLTTVGSAASSDGGGAYPLAAGAPSAAPSAASLDQFSSGAGASQGPANVTDNLQIVYTGSLNLVVADLAPALAKAKTAVAAAGGYIGASQESNDNDRPTATVTYRIPAVRWEDTITALRSMATKVVTEQTQAAEVGSQIVDLEARLRSLRAGEAALLEIAKGAGKISDLLDVQAQLITIRGQIEELDAQRTRLADQVSYGTLVTTFGTEVVAVHETTKGWDPAKDVDNATAALIGVGQQLGSAGIWFAIVVLPMVVVLFVLSLIVFRLFRRFGPKPRHHDPIPGWGPNASGGAGGGPV